MHIYKAIFKGSCEKWKMMTKKEQKSSYVCFIIFASERNLKCQNLKICTVHIAKTKTKKFACAAPKSPGKSAPKTQELGYPPGSLKVSISFRFNRL